jgi:adenylate cyclase
MKQEKRKQNYCYLLTFTFWCTMLCAQNRVDKGRLTINDDSILTRSYLNKAIDFLHQAHHDSAGIYLNRALEHSRETGNKTMEAEALISKGRFELSYHNRFDRATFLFFQSLALYDSLGIKDGSAQCYLQLGIISHDLQDYTESIHYFGNVLRLARDESFTKATAYYLSALSYSEIDSFDKAISMFDIAMQSYAKMGKKENELWCKVFLGKMYSNTGDHQRSIRYLTQLINDPEYLHDSSSLMPAFAFLSAAYAKSGGYKKSIFYGNLANKLGQSEPGASYYLKDCYASLHHSYFHTGDIQKAYFYLNMLNTLKDSVYNNNVLQGIGKIKSQYEYEQQLHLEKAEQEKKDILTRKELEKQKLIRNSSLLGLAIVLLFALVFFNQRNKIKTGKALSDKLLLNILPVEVAEELKAKGYAEAKYFKDVTVMFTDFKSFTLISERLNPSELVAELHTCFKAFDQIITQHGLEKIKTIGDSYMCAGGIPASSHSHATDIVQAALDIRQFMTEEMHKRKAAGKEYFEIRIGIHTGPVVAGIVGVKKFAYDIWGDTVNIASRMEASGEPGKINISQSTYGLVKNNFTCLHRGKIKAKHKGEIDMYFVEPLI